MLNNYAKNYSETVNQLIIINKNGIIIESNCNTFNTTQGLPITSLHPFFETITPLLNRDNQDYNFNCINLDLKDKNVILDIALKTFKKEAHALLIIHDLTQQYTAYQKVAQLSNESKLESEISLFKNKLFTQKQNYKNTFIRNFSHEIKMPINTISAATILLENANLSENQLHTLNVIKSTNDTLKYMVNDILDLSKIESGHINILENELHLANQLQLIIDFYTQKCNTRPIDLSLEIDSKCPEYILSDKFRLAQIASNIIGNALKFTNSGRIDLKVKLITETLDTSTLEFTIKDTGIGITQDNIAYIFDSFYQINNKQSNLGMGLGLAIVKQLVDIMGGHITVSSTLGKGTEFTIVLTFKKVKTAIIKMPIRKAKKIAKTNTYKILVGEAVNKDRVSILNLLNNAGIYAPVVVDNGDEVINKLHQTPFDIVLLNLQLPTMDGIAVTRYLRNSKIAGLNNLRIVAVTETPSKEEERYCIDKQMDGYISKPYNSKKVLKTLNSIIKKKRA